MLSSIAMVCIPLAVAVLLALSLPVVAGGPQRSPGTTSPLSENQRVLYVYESLLSRMSWDAVPIADGGRASVVLVPDDQAIAELEEAGYHLRVDRDGTVLFSNFDEADAAMAAEHENLGHGAEGGLVWQGDRCMIAGELDLDGIPCVMTALYDAARADESTARSITPVVLMSPAALAILVAGVLAAAAAVGIVSVRRIGRAFIEPLGELRDGVERVAAGEYGARIRYAGEDEFGEVFQGFDKMSVQLKRQRDERDRLEQQRRDMLAGISHDLRSPLTSIRGYAEGLKQGISGTPEKRERYCDAILVRSADMEGTLDALSSLVRAEDMRGRLDAEEADLDEYLLSFMRDHAAHAERNGVTFSYEGPARTVRALIDRREMNRALGNLLDNTVKYREGEASQVALKLRLSDDSRRAIIDYSDDGPGVPDDQIPLVFDAFWRSDEARTRPEEGSGLGLAVVKAVIEAHGGKVSAYLDGGLGIRMELPAREGGEGGDAA